MRTRVLLLAGQTVALGLMMAFLVVPVSALFLHEYGPGALPYVYLIVAVAGVAVSSLMSRAERRLSLAGLAGSVVATYLVAVAVGWVALAVWDGLWVTFPLLVLFPLSIPIGFVLVGSQAGRLLDVRQMKAQFPRVAAGFSVGFAVGGIAAAALVGPLGGPENLLGLDVLAAGLMLGLVLITARQFPADLRAVPERVVRTLGSPDTEASLQWRVLLTNRLVALILAYQLLSAAVTQLLDYMVWNRAAARFPDPSELAQFQGVFGAIINVVSVLFVVTLGGWMLTRFGLGLGLAANPLGVLVLLVATVVVGYLVGPAALVFFVLVCAQQVTDITLTDGSTRTSINATYQALPPRERVRAQTLVEGAGVPLALGFVGILLIGFDVLGLGVRAVGVITLLLSGVWLASAALAYREYGVNLRAVLTKRPWDPVALRIDDAASRAAVDEMLASPDPHDVGLALDALVDAGDDVSGYVLALLADPGPAQRELGLEMAAGAGYRELPAVAAEVHRLLGDPDPGVALWAAAAMVRRGAGRGGPGRTTWVVAAASADAEEVHRALRAATALPDPFYVPYLLGMAAARSASADVLDALAAHADHLAPRVEGLLADSSVPQHVRQRIVHALGRAGTPEARDLLVAHLGDGDPGIVEAAASCLVAVGHRESPERLDLRPKLLAVADRVDRCLRVLLLLDDRPDHEPLRHALRDEVAAGARRVEVLLDLVHDARAIRSGVAALASSVERDRSTALEMLEVTVGRSLAGTVLALVDPAPDDAARHRLLALFTEQPTRSLGGWLENLVRDDAEFWRDPWLRACAMYAVPSELPGEARTLVGPFVTDLDRDVAETARWVVDRVAQDVPAS